MLTIILTIIILSSCKTTSEMSYREFSDSLSDYRTTKLIELHTIFNIDKNYIEFENRNSIIYISIDKLISYAQERTNDSMCKPKKLVLAEIISKLTNSESNYYYIEKETAPEQYKKLKYPNPRRYKKNFIEPYGYPIEIDTIGKYEFKFLKYWIISELCIRGECLVIDKRSNEFADTIYFEVIDFKDGHGGESLTFSDKKPYFNVEVYTSIAWPDFDCMTKEEIENWKNN